MLNTSMKVLLVEDDPHVRLGYEQALRLADFDVLAVESVEAAAPYLQARFPGIVVTDMKLPGADGMSLLRRLNLEAPELPVIMITGHGDVSLAVEAMRGGAYDFMPKPCSTSRFIDVVRQAMEKRFLSLDLEAVRAGREAPGEADSLARRLIGRSPQMVEVRRLLSDVASANVDVLIVGETGTGKEMVARCLHDASGGRAERYVALNCGGMSDTLLDSELFGHEAGAFTGAQRRRIGKIEYADGGTLFLDEVESMPMNMQIKLLRVLQERVLERLGSNQPIPVDCRIVAASKCDLSALADQGGFRRDLYYRLNVVRIYLPPLRERREDIPLLYQDFLAQAASRYNRPVPRLASEHARHLMAHDWPGNIRELRNAADCHVLGLPFSGRAQPLDAASLPAAVNAYERLLIADELARHGGNIARTAEALQVARTTLHDKMRKHGLSELNCGA